MDTPLDHSAEWKMTSQGSTLAGLPSDSDSERLWRYCTFLREAVYSFPSNARIEEYDEYVRTMGDILSVRVHRRYNIWCTNPCLGH